MAHSEEIQKELNELAPKLGGVEKKNPFSAPDYYFRGLPEKMLERIKSQPQPWTDKLEAWLNNIFSLIFRPRYAVSVSAFLLVAIVAINFNRNENQQPGIQQELASIPAVEINNYIAENFDEEHLTELSPPTAQALIIPDDIPDEELENYFDNHSDNQILEEELL